MVNIAANMTQVLTNSPQVTALVAGEAGALEQIRRQGRLDESRRLEEEARSKVLLAERSARPGESGEKAGRLAVSEEGGRRNRKKAPLAAGRERGPEAPSPLSEASIFEARRVIDRCV